MLYSITATDQNNNAVRITKDSLRIAKAAAKKLHDTNHTQVIVWNGEPGSVRLETLADPTKENEAASNYNIPKSEGHICFSNDSEFYEGRDGNVYRAKIDSVFDHGFRIGRWECSRAHFEHYRDIIIG